MILFWTSSREALRFDNPSRPLGGRQAAAGVTGDKIANSLFEIGLDSTCMWANSWPTHSHMSR